MHERLLLGNGSSQYAFLVVWVVDFSAKFLLIKIAKHYYSSQKRHETVIAFLTFFLCCFQLSVLCLHMDVCRLIYSMNTVAIGKMRNCGMRKVKCGIKNAE